MKFLVGFKNILDNKIWMSGLFLLCFILSWVGVYNAEHYDGSVWYAGYDALRLFTLNGNDFDVVQQWQWSERNKLLLVMVWLDAIYLVLAVFSFFTQRLIRFVLSRASAPSDKTIVVLGLGAWGLHYVKALLASNFHVIAIEKNPSDQAVNELIKHRKKYGNRVALIEGDCFDTKVLDKAKVVSVGKVLPMLADDASNIDVAYKIRKYVGPHKKGRNKPVIMLAVDNIRLSTSLATYKRFSEYHGETEIRFFNIMQQAAVRHLMKHPTELYADIFGHSNVHFAIYGLGDFAINLIYVIAQIGHYRTWSMEDDPEKAVSSRVKITIFDQKPKEEALVDLKALFPNLDKVVELKYRSTQLMNINFDDLIMLNNVKPVTQHIFCVNNETLAVRYATKLRKAQTHHTNANTPIFVRSLDGSGISRLVESNCGDEEWPDNIFPLTLLSDHLGENDYFDSNIECIAKAFNNFKVTEEETKEKELKKKDAGQLWAEISSDFKHSSLYQAFFLASRLRSIGYQWVPQDENKSSSDDGFGKWKEKSNQQLHKHIARLEHDRWKSERWLLGWTDQGERTLDDIARVHPELEGKATCEKWWSTYDIEQATFLPEYLKDAKCTLLKRRIFGLVEGGGIPINYNSTDTVMFNLFDYRSLQKVEEKFSRNDTNTSTGVNHDIDVLGLLPLPFEVLKALVPLVLNKKRLCSLAGGDEKKKKLVQCITAILSPRKKGEIGDLLKRISSLSGEVNTYIEMPLSKKFGEWKQIKEKQLDDLFDACNSENNQIIDNVSKYQKELRENLESLHNNYTRDKPLQEVDDSLLGELNTCIVRFNTLICRLIKDGTVLGEDEENGIKDINKYIDDLTRLVKDLQSDKKLEDSLMKAFENRNTFFEQIDWLKAACDAADLYIKTRSHNLCVPPAGSTGATIKTSYLIKPEPVEGNKLDLEHESKAQKVQKKATPVTVNFAATAGVCNTKEGNVTYKAGDAILTGLEGEQWPIERPKFDATYEPLTPTEAGVNGRYSKRPLIVYALQMNETFHVNVSWTDDRLEGKSGDWLLQYGENDYGIVSESIFEKTYTFLC